MNITRLVNHLYHSHCCPVCSGQIEMVHLNNSDHESVEDLYRSIQSGSFSPEKLNKSTVLNNAKTLQRAFNKETGNNFEEPDYRTPDYNWVQGVNENLFYFAGAKNYNELSDLQRMLTKDGKLVPFNQFERNVQWYHKKKMQIENQYNKNWLRAEYNHAQKVANASARWSEFENNSDIYPNLRYRTTGDSRVRDSHRRLNGVVRPLNDPFWDRYSPPNDWNCRCRLEPTAAKPTDKGPDIPMKAMFKNNPAKTGAVFTERHPYHERSKSHREEIKTQTIGFMKELRVERNTAYRKLVDKNSDMNVGPMNQQGGFVAVQTGANSTAQELAVANYLKGNGNMVVIKAVGNDDFKKNPDFEVDRAVFEVKSITGNVKKKTEENVSRAFEQATRAILHYEEAVPWKDIARGLGNARKYKRYLDVLILNGKDSLFITKMDMRNGRYDELIKAKEPS